MCVPVLVCVTVCVSVCVGLSECGGKVRVSI